jgi:hypothetical protein
MTFETLKFLEQVSPAGDGQGSAVAAALARADAADRAEEAAERREAEEKRAAAAERMENLALQNRALGNPLGELQAARSAVAAADDEIADLQARLSRLQTRRDRAASSAEFWATRLQPASDCAQRSDPFEAASRRAQEAFAQLRRDAADDDVIRRARASQARAGRTLSRPLSVRSRPFGGSGPGEVNGAAVAVADRAATHSLRPETYEDLLALPRGVSSRGGCPPCGGCDYVICRCSQYPDPGSVRSAPYSEFGPSIVRVTEDALVSVR